jgi:glycine/D-amino acid oxidase-like deaminating enzyme
MRAAEGRGAILRHEAVVDLMRNASGAVRGVALASGEVVEGDAVVIAMGPWSVLAARWLPLPAVFGYKGHSLVFETGGAIPAEALFLEYRETTGEMLSPEIMPRADGTTWVCAVRAPRRCQSILPMLDLTKVRTRAWSSCAGTFRPRSRPAQSKRGRRVSGQSLRTACR